MFFHGNHTVLDMRQSILSFSYFSRQLKTPDHKHYSNVMEQILNSDDITIPPNEGTTVTVKSQIYIVTAVLQPMDRLNEECDITFFAALVTLSEGTTSFHINNFTDQSFKLKNGLHRVEFLVLTPEQMKQYSRNVESPRLPTFRLRRHRRHRTKPSDNLW